MLNVSPEFEFKFKHTLDISPLGVDFNMPLYTLSQRPDLSAAVAHIKEALSNVQASEKSFYPSITLGESLSRNDDKF